MDIEELRDMYNNFIIATGEDYWKYIILEHLLNNFGEEEINNLHLTEDKINDMAYNIMINDRLWKEIDYAIEDEITESSKEITCMTDVCDLDFDEQCLLLNNNKKLFNDCLDTLTNTDGYELCDSTDFNLIKDVLNTYYLQDYDKYFVDEKWNMYFLDKGKYELLFESDIK